MEATRLIIPPDYHPLLNLRETERAIKLIKDYFEEKLASSLNLLRVSAPLFVRTGTGINDDLNGVEKPVSFSIKDDDHSQAEIVQSLAKWKRLMLANYGFEPGEGLYTDMNAIRPDEAMDNLHSIYVDQWDWERIITREERNLEFLKEVVRKIYITLKETESYISSFYPVLKPILPPEIHFVHAQELEELYPELTPKEREDAICKQYGSVFIIGIGGTLKNGKPHDLRAPDYDDWSSLTENGRQGLNGDILLWNPVLNRAFEISSMGIRVDESALMRQLEICGKTERRNLFFHQQLLQNALPLSIGGGLGQSRICMFMLRKAHVGEVQTSIWPEEMVRICRDKKIVLL